VSEIGPEFEIPINLKPTISQADLKALAAKLDAKISIKPVITKAAINAAFKTVDANPTIKASVRFLASQIKSAFKEATKDLDLVVKSKVSATGKVKEPEATRRTPTPTSSTVGRPASITQNGISGRGLIRQAERALLAVSVDPSNENLAAVARKIERALRVKIPLEIDDQVIVQRARALQRTLSSVLDQNATSLPVKPVIDPKTRSARNLIGQAERATVALQLDPTNLDVRAVAEKIERALKVKVLLEIDDKGVAAEAIRAQEKLTETLTANPKAKVAKTRALPAGVASSLALSENLPDVNRLTTNFVRLETSVKATAKAIEAIDKKDLNNLDDEGKQALKRFQALEKQVAQTRAEIEKPSKFRQGLAKIGIKSQDLPDLETIRARSEAGRRRNSALDALNVGQNTTAGRTVRSFARVAQEIGGPVALGAGIIRLGQASFRAFQQTTKEVREFANAANLSAPAASRLLAITKQVGIDPDRSSRALLQLAKNADDPRLAARLKALSGSGPELQVAKFRNGSVDLEKTLLSISDAYTNASGNATEQTNLLFDAFGRQADTLVPLLELGRAGIEKLQVQAAARGEIFSQDDLEKAKKLDRSLKDISQSLSSAGRNAVSGSAPVITGIANAASKGLVDLGKFASLISTIFTSDKRKIIDVKARLTLDEASLKSFNEASEASAQNAADIFANTIKAGTAKPLQLGQDVLGRDQAPPPKTSTSTTNKVVQSAAAGALNAVPLIGPGLSALLGNFKNTDVKVLDDLKSVIGTLVERGDIDALKTYRAQLILGPDAAKSKDQIAALDAAILAAGKAVDTNKAKQDLWRVALADTVPTLAELRAGLDGSEEAARAFGDAVIKQVEALAGLGNAKRQYKQSQDDYIQGLKEADRAEAEANPDSNQSKLKAVEAQITEVTAREKAIKSAKDEVKAKRDSARSIVDGERAIAANRREAPRNARAIANAERDLQRARDDVPRSDLNIAQAELALNRARQQGEDLPFKIGAAERSLRDVRTGAVDAIVSERRASEDATDSRRKNQAELRIFNQLGGAAAESQLSVREATLALTEAQKQQIETTKAVNDSFGSLIVAGESLGGTNQTFGQLISKLEATRRKPVDVAKEGDSPEAQKLKSDRAIFDARKQLLRAQAELNVTDPKTFTRGIEDSDRSLRDARVALSDSTIKVTESERDLARLRKEGPVDAALALKSAEFGLVDARRTQVDDGGKILDLEDSLANARFTEDERMRSLVRLTEDLRDRRQEAADVKDNTLENLGLQKDKLSALITKQTEAFTLEDKSYKLAVERNKLEDQRNALQEQYIQLLIAEAAAKGAPLSDRQIADLRAVATTQRPVNNQTDVAVNDLQRNRTSDTLTVAGTGRDFTTENAQVLDAKRAEILTKLADLQIQIDANKKKQAEVDAAAQKPLDRAGQTAAGQAIFDTKKQGDDLRKQSVAIADQAIKDLAKQIVDLGPVRRTKGESPEVQAQIKATNDQIAAIKALIAKLEETKKASAPRFAGGSVYAGQRITANELGVEHMRTRDGVFALEGGQFTGKAKVSGYITPHNVKPATNQIVQSLTKNNTARTFFEVPVKTKQSYVMPVVTRVSAPAINPAPVVVQVPKQEPSFTIENLNVVTNSESSEGRAVDMVVAMRARMLMRS
jgi:hypothetical protein